MRYVHVIIVCLFCGCLSALGQPRGNFLRADVLKLVDSAKSTWCRGDTARAIKLLEALEAGYPRDGAIEVTNRVVAGLYLARGNSEQALRKAQYAMRYVPDNYFAWPQEETECDKKFYGPQHRAAKAALCVQVSRIYLQQRCYDSALHYLKLADSAYHPYKGCGNGYIMYSSYLSPLFADVYMARADTAAAIDRLLRFLLMADGDMEALARNLKQVLLYSHSRAEINAEIDRAVAQMKFVNRPGDTGRRDLEACFFGHRFLLSRLSQGTIEDNRQKLEQHPAIKILRR